MRVEVVGVERNCLRKGIFGPLEIRSAVPGGTEQEPIMAPLRKPSGQFRKAPDRGAMIACLQCGDALLEQGIVHGLGHSSEPVECSGTVDGIAVIQVIDAVDNSGPISRRSKK